MDFTHAVNKLSHSTPISVALMLSFCAGAYWTGTVATRVASLEQRGVEDRATRERLAEISAELAAISRDNQRRIQYLERQITSDK
jgi:hypothetical protein